MSVNLYHLDRFDEAAEPPTYFMTNHEDWHRQVWSKGEEMQKPEYDRVVAAGKATFDSFKLGRSSWDSMFYNRPSYSAIFYDNDGGMRQMQVFIGVDDWVMVRLEQEGSYKFPPGTHKFWKCDQIHGLCDFIRKELSRLAYPT
jgi:hypothetical protein